MPDVGIHLPHRHVQQRIVFETLLADHPGRELFDRLRVEVLGPQGEGWVRFRLAIWRLGGHPQGVDGGRDAGDRQFRRVPHLSCFDYSHNP